LGVLALQRTSFTSMLDHTARVTAEGLAAEYCKVMEYLPAENRLLVRAGVGWDEGVVGVASVGADLESPPGYALRTGKPVISNHLENERRFSTPDLLIQYGIRRAMNVILQGDGSPFGVLEVDSKSEGEFGEHEAQQTSSGWRLSNRIINANSRWRSIVIKSCSKRSTTA
jgi:GAF domain-containing protein